MKKVLRSTIALAGLLVAMSACKDSFIDTASSEFSGAKEAGTTTGQGIMANLNVASVVINEEGTWTFDQTLAKTFYSTAQVGPAVVTTGQAPNQTSPGVPAADPIGNNVVAQDRCVFFSGGALKSYTYTKTVNGTKGWKWTYTYVVTGQTVPAKTAWSFAITTPGVDPEVPIDVTIAGLSAMSSKQHPLKYSFSLLGDDGITSRIADLKVSVTKAAVLDGDGNEISPAVTMDYTPTHSLISGTDFVYTTNAGSNGTTSLLTGTDGQLASWILSAASGDTFTGNDAASNIVCAKSETVKPTLGVGSYTITMTATVKGNSASAATPISVTKNLIISGGCN